MADPENSKTRISTSSTYSHLYAQGEMLSRLTGRRVFLSARVRAVIGQVRLSLSRGSSCRAWWKALITPTERRPNICSRISSGRSRQDRALVVFLRTRPAPTAQPTSSTARCRRSRKTRLRGGIPVCDSRVLCQDAYPLEENAVSPALTSSLKL